ncbi:MAG: hypothetical protein HY014_04455 [Acidobacteria bacterium]|nr:hypothetical protein [Acidobacteriota bacterium]MBI3487403.1 hypothetical protein [Acidobacteriota bacterium]
MKPAEAEKLLGGYAAGTLTETERQDLFAAAMDHQEVFDALADEEILRDLLADPVARAQLLAALNPAADPRLAAPPKVVPFWRRTGVLGAAASLLVAATAGLVYLRSPDKVPPPLASQQAPAPKAAETQAPSAPGQAPAIVLRKRLEAGADKVQDKVQGQVQGQLQAREEAAPLKAKKAEASKPAAAAVPEVVAVPKEEAARREDRAPAAKAVGLPPARSAAGIAGLASGAAGPVPAPAPAAASAAMAQADRRNANAYSQDGAPVRWSLRTRPDGSTTVEVRAPRETHLVLLRRGRGGVAVIALQFQASGGAGLWRGEARLGEGDALDLYRLNQAVADPAALPETGPFDGFRARIHPAAK